MIYLINEEIKNYGIKILTVITFVMLSVPLWTIFENNSYATTAKEYDTYVKNLAKINYEQKEYNKDNNSYYVSLNLDNNKNQKEYFLLLKIDNKYNTQDIKINFNNEIKNIEEIRYNYSENYNYFLIDKGILSSEKDYNIDIILPSYIDSFIYNFELIEK
ncbi:MAG: hypothetical protein IJB82_03145 [Bacilli bacterium]|nr:hypothetical protein [Bacilli bacterium]